MPSCWRVVGRYPFTTVDVVRYLCNSGSTQPARSSQNPFYYVGVTTPDNPFWGSVSSITEVSTAQCVSCGPPPPLNPSQPHDCLNGNCLPSSVYLTPGMFASLAACQSSCAKNSNCRGECVPVAEITNLRQAVTTLSQKVCK